VAFHLEFSVRVRAESAPDGPAGAGRIAQAANSAASKGKAGATTPSCSAHVTENRGKSRSSFCPIENVCPLRGWGVGGYSRQGAYCYHPFNHVR
jgi:hypothetical protein